MKFKDRSIGLAIVHTSCAKDSTHVTSDVGTAKAHKLHTLTIVGNCDISKANVVSLLPTVRPCNFKSSCHTTPPFGMSRRATTHRCKLTTSQGKYVNVTPHGASCKVFHLIVVCFNHPTYVTAKQIQISIAMNTGPWRKNLPSLRPLLTRPRQKWQATHHTHTGHTMRVTHPRNWFRLLPFV